MKALRGGLSLRAPAGPARTALLALGVQSGLAMMYLALTDAGIASPGMLAVPFVWVTAAIVAVRHAEAPEGSRGVRVAAAVIGLAYGIGLAWLTGTVGLATGSATGFDLVFLPPGWGPVVRYGGAFVSVVALPYRVVGYAALAYLVSLAVRDIAVSGASMGIGGLLAIGSCASCALPVVAAVGSVLGGAGLALGAMPAVGGGTYLLATAAFLLSAGVLAVRPTVRV